MVSESAAKLNCADLASLRIIVQYEQRDAIARKNQEGRLARLEIRNHASGR